jgi:amino-acid N-acetyltransferase
MPENANLPMTTGTGPSPAAAPSTAQATTIKPTDLRGILQYVPRFQGQIFVIAIDGSIVADDNFQNLLVDIAVLRSLGIKIVLVHGIGHQLIELSKLRSTPITNSDGTGVTDAATLDLGIRASSRVSHIILEGLTGSSLKAVITNAVRAVPIGIIKGIDQQLTGRVDRIDKELIKDLIERQVVPLVSPLAFGPDGKSLRVNSDLLAAEMAEALGATKIIYLAPSAGLEIDNKVRHEISVDALRTLLSDHPEKISGSSRSKATYAVKDRDRNAAGARRRRARLRRPAERDLLQRGRGLARLRQRLPADPQGQPPGRAAPLQPDAQRREAGGAHQPHAAGDREEHRPVLPVRGRRGGRRLLYVLPFYHNKGIGKKMVEFACLQAKERGAKRVIALSTQSFGFFSNVCGFEESTKEILPETRLKSYEDNGRNAKVLVKNIA